MKAAPNPFSRRLLLLALPATLFLLALNPWFSPEQHDDVTYFFSAKSLAEHGSFALDGIPVTDWPPVFPAILAAARLLAGGSTLVAKLVVLAFVCGGVFVIRRVAANQHFAHPTLIAVITCLLPISLICGANVLSEWPFLTLSMLFLLSLQRLEHSRTLLWISSTGILLAAASLTRFSGVLLGAAIIAQAIKRIRAERSLRSISPELFVACIGAAPWLLWKLHCQLIIARGDAPPGAYDQPGYYLDRFTNFDITGLFATIESTLLSATRASSQFTDHHLVSIAIVSLLAIAMVVGAILHFRSYGIAPADWYVFANLALLVGDLMKPERYFLPIAPFLIGYLMVSIQALADTIARQRSRQVFAAAIASWIALLLALDAHLLFKGNSDGSRGGQSMLASPDIESFYRGENLDLYHAIRSADRHARRGDPIAAAGFHGKYLLALAGRSFETFPDDDLGAADWLVERHRDNDPEAKIPGDWRLIETFGSHRVFQRLP